MEFQPIPLTKIAMDHTGSVRGKNVVALGALGNLFDMEFDVLKKLIADRYGSKGADVTERNMKALAAGFAEAERVLQERGEEPCV